MLRLDKYLSDCKIASRSEIKKLIKNGSVSVNGEPQGLADRKINPEKDRVYLDGQAVVYQKYIYILMNKPQGVVSATYDKVHKTVIDLLPERMKSYEPFPVGRLDIDTEGLLLLTNDGELAHNLLSPKKHVPKTYFAHVEGNVCEEDAEAFSQGVFIGEYKTLPASLEIIESGDISKVWLTITEGKFHQVKRMFEAVGKKVVYLKRIQMGRLALPPDLEPGEVVELEGRPDFI